MIAQLATIFGTTLIAFVVFALLTSSEQRRGQRFFLSGVRGWCDAQVAHLERALGHVVDYLTRRVIKFTWYYSLHSFFRGLRALLEKAYLYVEYRMRFHHRQAKAARTERSGSFVTLGSEA